MTIEYLKEMAGLTTDEKSKEVFPAPYQDLLDSEQNISKYSFAKPILEHPEVIPVLLEMGAYDLLNPYNIDSYYEMAQHVSEALHAFSQETKDTDQAIEFNELFKIEGLSEELGEFAEEFLMEFTKQRYSKMGSDDEIPSINPPEQSQSWLEKLASKFGIHELGVKDFMYLYLFSMMNKNKDKKGEDDNRLELPVREEYMPLLSEKAPPGMEGWINSVKDKFKKKYGDKWEDVLYSTAWKKYKEQELKENWEDDEIPYKEMSSRLESNGWEENGGVALWSHPDHPTFWLDGNTGYLWVFPTRPLYGPFSGESGEAMMKVFKNMDEFFKWVESGEADKAGERTRKAGVEAGWRGYVEDSGEDSFYEGVKGVTEDIDDIYGGATKQNHFPRPSDKKVPKASAKVNSDIKKRLKELDKLIKDFKDKKHFLGEIKPAIFNAKESLEFIQGKLKDGSMESYKEAQIHFQKLMSPITNLFPPSLVKYLAHPEEEDSRLKPVED